MEMICLDTNILIAHKRAKQKDPTKLYQLSTKYCFAVTSITAYELNRGDNSNEKIAEELDGKLKMLQLQPFIG